MTSEPRHPDDDRMVGERLRSTLLRVEAPPADLDRVVAKVRRRRASRLAAALAVGALVLVAGVALPLTVLAPGRDVQRPPANPAPAAGPQPATTSPGGLPAARAGWVWHQDPAGRFAIQAPAAWRVSSGTGMQLAEPTPLLIAGTGTLATGGDCAPRGAIKALPRDGALFWVVEYAGTRLDFNPYEFPPRSGGLRLGPAVSRECIGEPSHQLLFRLAGRFFQAQVLFGPAASGSLRAAVVASLESFRPEPATVSPTEQCRRQWVFCPEAAWAFRVIDQAGLFHWGNSGSALQVGPQGPRPDPGRKFSRWTTGGPMPTSGLRQKAVVGGITVHGDGGRLVWRAQGLNVWVRADRGASTLPRGAMLARLVEASRTVRSSLIARDRRSGHPSGRCGCC